MSRERAGTSLGQWYWSRYTNTWDTKDKRDAKDTRELKS